MLSCVGRNVAVQALRLAGAEVLSQQDFMGAVDFDAS